MLDAKEEVITRWGKRGICRQVASKGSQESAQEARKPSKAVMTNEKAPVIAREKKKNRLGREAKNRGQFGRLRKGCALARRIIQ